jgi:hypothetical protein
VWGRAIRMKVALANRPLADEEDENGFEAARRARTIHQLR